MECGEPLNMHQPEPPHQEEPSSLAGTRESHSGDEAAATKDAMDVTTDNSKDITRNATELSTKDEAIPPTLDETNDSTKAEPREGHCNDKATDTKDAMDVTTDSLEDIARNATALSTKDETTLPTLDETNDTKVEPHAIETNPKGTDETNVDNNGMDMSPGNNPSVCAPLTRLPPGRRGEGRDAKEMFFHTVPKSHGGPDKKRAVFRVWPRRPDGKPIVPTKEPTGTLSPDGYPWGATLYDFYKVNTVPGDESAMSHMTSSALVQAMKTLEEYDATAPEFEWALSEGTPRDEGVTKTELSITSAESEVLRGVIGNRPILDRSGQDGSDCALKKEKEEKHDKEDEAIVIEQAMETDGGNKEKSNDEDDDGKDEGASNHNREANEENKTASDDIDSEVKSDPKSVISVTSPFHPSHYPQPWPFVPFEKTLSVLQERIPLYLLPRKLCVHDPFNLLSARERWFPKISWNSRPDVVRTYNLELSEDPEEERRKAEELEEFKARTLVVLRYQRTEEQIKDNELVIEVPLPPYPRRMTSVEESHLYLSPVAKAGEGHHSIVYKGEWELPRDLFVRPKICPDCFNECVEKEIQKLKDTGGWEKLARAAGSGRTGFTGRQSTQAESDEVGNPTNLGMDGEIVEREIICVVPPNPRPSHLLEMIDEGNTWDLLMEKRDMKTVVLDSDFRVAKNSDEEDPVVTIVRIDPPFSYESQKTCTHSESTRLLNMFPVPRTAKFTVIAKLSFEDDFHIMRETCNYQQFPEHFFQHYDGYTLIDQLHAIVPVHAIVPQFYGYYTPQKDEGEESYTYLSPILLLEHCGKPVDPETLSLEDQEESVSMVLRFQRAGWLHESLFPRNFLVQKRKPTESPLQTQARSELSFRLIDFGRTKRLETTMERRQEEKEAVEMFQKLRGKMTITAAVGCPCGGYCGR